MQFSAEQLIETDSYTRAQWEGKIRHTLEAEPFFHTANGVRITELGDGYAKGEAAINYPNSYNFPGGSVHGGVIATLADTVASVAVNAMGVICATVDCTLHYYRPPQGDTLFCSGTVDKAGRTICVSRTELTDGTGALVATGTFTLYVKHRVTLLD